MLIPILFTRCCLFDKSLNVCLCVPVCIYNGIVMLVLVWCVVRNNLVNCGFTEEQLCFC